MASGGTIIAARMLTGGNWKAAVPSRCLETCRVHRCPGALTPDHFDPALWLHSSHHLGISTGVSGGNRHSSSYVTMYNYTSVPFSYA